MAAYVFTSFLFPSLSIIHLSTSTDISPILRPSFPLVGFSFYNSGFVTCSRLVLNPPSASLHSLNKSMDKYAKLLKSYSMKFLDIRSGVRAWETWKIYFGAQQYIQLYKAFQVKLTHFVLVKGRKTSINKHKIIIILHLVIRYNTNYTSISCVAWDCGQIWVTPKLSCCV